MAKDDHDKAETLNEYFGSVFSVENIHSIPFFERKCSNLLTTIEFSTEEIEDLLMHLDINKSPGPDGIHSRVLKETHAEIAKPLQLIFTKLLNEGKNPSSWKEAIVVPIFKKGKRSDPANYRPVSLTSVVCKTMEKIVRKHIIHHLEQNKVMSEEQHGFRAGRSCTTQLLEVCEEWTDVIDVGHNVDCIYLDYRKAFDSVPHKRLTCKLQLYGIDGPLLAWIKDYLTNRTQKVVINGKESKSIPVTSGIPQGSVLGPILFNIFINDLPSTVDSHMKLFADDTKLYRIVDSKADSELLQKDINTVADWSIKWQLPFNESKCKVVHYGKKNQEFDYTLPTGKTATTVTSDTEEKDLGVLFQQDLSFSNHVADAAKRANIKLGLIKRSFSTLQKKGFLCLYKSIIRPTLEYCNSVWCPILKRDEDILEKVQQRATRLLPEVNQLSYPNRLKELQLPTLAYRRQRADMIQIFKILKGFDNVNPSKFFQLATDSKTRGHNFKIVKQRFRTRLRQHTFSIRSVNNWNALPTEVVNATTINQFKSSLERHWRNNPIKFEPYLRRDGQ